MADPDKRYGLGVLFIHGIGTQTEGDTLVRFGEPLCHWLARWIDGADGVAENRNVTRPCVVLTGANLRPSGAPAHVQLDLRIPERGGETRSRWLLAESWWAEAFATPTYRQLAYWAFLVLPWTVASHFGTPLRRTWSTLSKAPRNPVLPLGALLMQLVQFLLGLAVAPIAVSVILVLMVLGLLPFPRVRAWIAKIQRGMAASVGDSFILLESPIQRAAILGRVQRDMRWLESQCDTLAIVAHSQGAAIAHAAIRDRSPKNLELLVTLGSGLNKLSAIERIRKTTDKWKAWLAPAGLAMLAYSARDVFWALVDNLRAALALVGMYVVTMLVFALAKRSRRRVAPIILTVVLLAIFAVTTVFFFLPVYHSAGTMLLLFFVGSYLLLLGSAGALTHESDLEGLRLREGIQWVDLYASADPVSNGPLIDDPPSTLMTHAMVYNGASVLTDHTSYWKNLDEFVGIVACKLAGLKDIDLTTLCKWDAERLEVAKRRRKWRVGWLLFARGVVASASIAVPVALWNRLPASWAELPRTWGELPSSMPTVSPAVGLILDDLWYACGAVISQINRIPGVDVHILPQQLFATPKVAAAMVAMLAGIIGYSLVYSVWRWWNMRDVNVMFLRRRIEDFTYSYPVFVLTLLLVAEVGVLTAMGWSTGLALGMVGAAFCAFAITALLHWRELQPKKLRILALRVAMGTVLFAPALVRGRALYPSEGSLVGSIEEDTTGRILVWVAASILVGIRITMLSKFGKRMAHRFRHVSQSAPIVPITARQTVT